MTGFWFYLEEMDNDEDEEETLYDKDELEEAFVNDRDKEFLLQEGLTICPECGTLVEDGIQCNFCGLIIELETKLDDKLKW
jgi:rubrerythrin